MNAAVKRKPGYGHLLGLPANGPNVLVGAGKPVCAARALPSYLGLDKRVRRERAARDDFKKRTISRAQRSGCMRGLLE